ncbi:unnamed protein product [Rotaria sordida]|uniref:Apple domain-containing protein n=1 Tax=Rotaria sordida TaxID=392033 RepID=A0A814VDX0_9BILA|nr:unnamed protein product [Rotaria sordida]
MFWKVILCLIICYPLVWMIRITVINNATFDPINSNYWLGNISNITSRNLCICQCYTGSNCSTAIYYGRYQICLLYSAELSKGQLRLMNTSENAVVINFPSRNSVETETTTTITQLDTASSTSIPCVPSNKSVLTYNVTPIAYQQQTYTYTAVSTGMKQLEFGFKAGSASKTWHLDDVSIIDKNASNSEKLVNGGFENGTLTGWQVLCSTINCGTKAGNITQSNCHTGSYCYDGQHKLDIFQ